MTDATGPPILVLLVDDHPIVRNGIRSLMLRRRDIDIVGEAEDGDSAVSMAAQLDPDVVIMDIGLPQMSGFEAARLMLAQNPHMRIIMLTVYDNREYVIEALRIGASGYLIKNCPSEDLVKAIRSVHQGDLFFPQEGSSREQSQWTDHGVWPADTELTEREREVVGFIAEGYTNRRIADELRLGVRTVESHRENIMKKLKIHSVAGLTRYAISHGLTRID